MKKQVFISGIFLLFLTSCDLNQNVGVCSNPGGEFETIKVSKNRDQAIQDCQDHYNQNYSYPMSEIYCEVR